MEYIKEVALRISEQMVWRNMRNGYPDDETVVMFASRLIAELQKDATPVAWMAREDFEQMLSIGGNFVTGRKTGDDDVALYTHPQPKAATVPDVEALALHLHDADPINAACGFSIEEFRDSMDFDFYMRIANAAIGYDAPSLPAQSEGEQKCTK